MQDQLYIIIIVQRLNRNMAGGGHLQAAVVHVEINCMLVGKCSQVVED